MKPGKLLILALWFRNYTPEFLGHRAHRAAQPQPNPQTVLQENAEGAENLSNEIPLRPLRTPVKWIGLKICPTNMHAGKPHFEPLCHRAPTRSSRSRTLSALWPPCCLPVPSLTKVWAHSACERRVIAPSFSA